MFLARIYVTLKPTVNDPQGLTILGGLKSLGFQTASRVRAGKYLEVTLNEGQRQMAARRVEEMCRQLLANTVIEEYRYELEEVTPR